MHIYLHFIYGEKLQEIKIDIISTFLAQGSGIMNINYFLLLLAKFFYTLAEPGIDCDYVWPNCYLKNTITPLELNVHGV